MASVQDMFSLPIACCIMTGGRDTGNYFQSALLSIMLIECTFTEPW